MTTRLKKAVRHVQVIEFNQHRNSRRLGFHPTDQFVIYVRKSGKARMTDYMVDSVISYDGLLADTSSRFRGFSEMIDKLCHTVHALHIVVTYSEADDEIIQATKDVAGTIAVAMNFSEFNGRSYWFESNRINSSVLSPVVSELYKVYQKSRVAPDKFVKASPELKDLSIGSEVFLGDPSKHLAFSGFGIVIDIDYQGDPDIAILKIIHRGGVTMVHSGYVSALVARPKGKAQKATTSWEKQFKDNQFLGGKWLSTVDAVRLITAYVTIKLGPDAIVDEQKIHSFLEKHLVPLRIRPYASAYKRSQVLKLAARIKTKVLGSHASIREKIKDYQDRSEEEYFARAEEALDKELDERYGFDEDTRTEEEKDRE